MPFDKTRDKIAVTIPRFTIVKSSEGRKLLIGPRDKYNEPYIVSFAIDSAGAQNPKIDFNFETFPKVRVGDTIEMLGDGHLVYGPRNPGEFVAVSILMMESDSDVRDVGKQMKDLITSKAADLGMKALIAADPGSAAIMGVLKELALHISGVLESNKDDTLARWDGTFLRDSSVPYHINRKYTRRNDYVDLDVQIIPLSESNGQGNEVQSVDL